MSYKIVRHYAPGSNRRARTVKRGLTLEEAQAHCQREDTHKYHWRTYKDSIGNTHRYKVVEWFDGYTEE